MHVRCPETSVTHLPIIDSESEARHHRTGRDDGQVKGIGHRVGEAFMPRALKMVELPKSNHRISHECDHRRTSGQSVKAIGQVHGIRKTGDHQPAKDNVKPRERKAADSGRKNTEVNRQAAGKTNLGGDAAPVNGKYRKGDTDNG